MSVSIGFATYVHNLNGCDIHLITANYLIFNMQDLRNALWASMLDFLVRWYPHYVNVLGADHSISVEGGAVMLGMDNKKEGEGVKWKEIRVLLMEAGRGMGETVRSELLDFCEGWSGEDRIRGRPLYFHGWGWELGIKY